MLWEQLLRGRRPALSARAALPGLLCGKGPGTEAGAQLTDDQPQSPGPCSKLLSCECFQSLMTFQTSVSGQVQDPP